MNLTVYDECKQLTTSSISVQDYTPITLLLDKTTSPTPVVASWITIAIRNRFILDPQGCNVGSWQIYDGTFTTLQTPTHTLFAVNPVDNSPKHFKAKCDVPVPWTNFNLNAYTLGGQNASVVIRLKICGDEVVSQVDPTFKLRYIFKMQPGSQAVDFAAIKNTNLTNNDSVDCPINTQELLEIG